MPASARRDAEELLGRDFSDVRIHTDAHAGASAEAVAAHAYTVGRHLVFAPGRFEPESERGQKLLVHELVHAAGNSANAPMPSGDLRISTPADREERGAVRIAEGRAMDAMPAAAATPARLFRQPAPSVPLTKLRVDSDRVTVPPISGLSFSAIPTPSNASQVTFTVKGENGLVIAPGTTVSSSGAISVDAKQAGGVARARGDQPDGGWQESAPFHFCAIPAGISSTSVIAGGSSSSFYGGKFTHTFTAPKGQQQSALERSHVNEQFPDAQGTQLTLKGFPAPFTVTVNDPNDSTVGWDLDISGAMLRHDLVDWGKGTDARPFVVNASNLKPTSKLPFSVNATQNFRNLSFPDKQYGSAAVASTVQSRGFDADSNNRIIAVTSAGVNQKVSEAYAGPTIFHNIKATPASIPVTPPSTKGKQAPRAATSNITVDKDGQRATTRFSIQGPDLGCKISQSGVLTAGDTAGTVTVRAGDASNYDEVKVTITGGTAQQTPATPPGQNPGQNPNQNPATNPTTNPNPPNPPK